MEEIWHDVQKESGSILSSISSRTLSVPQANNDMVDLWLNLWCNNSKAILFLDGNFFDIEIWFISPNYTCLLYALCVKVTTFFSLAPNYTAEKPER